MIRKTALPAPWTFLLDADGRFDRHRLSSFRLSTGINIYALCGDGGDPPATVFVVAARIGNKFALLTDTPIRQVYGPALQDAALFAMAAFIEQNRSAPHAHWTGRLDSVELADALQE